uniref:Interleukin-1 beta n=1 Tax=Sinocyclocheilus anshuiensis TaxID=1608454 RepID=A0A671T818_9TELE
MEDTELGALQEPSHPQPEQKEKDIEDNCFVDDDVLRSLANMSLNLMVDQDSDADNPFCNGDWQLNESQIVAETADIAYSKNDLFFTVFIHFEVCNVEISISFIRKWKFCYLFSVIFHKFHFFPPPAKLTIFHGTFLGMVTSDRESGVPVVLNFTGTDNFLCCTGQGEDKILTIKSCIAEHCSAYDRKNIHISADDPEKSSLIFYMSQKWDGLRYFESALHRGWFIHTVNDDVVKMKRGNNTSSSCFVLE